ncbi:MAG: IclR family transcriptional regulator, partial [Kiritimatiellia bacterium]|nr:IclR family transcriptional regulator [Kiritimatiellia bacterium]
MVPSVERALLLMEFLGQSEQGATQQELAEALEITPSTCYRILRTLKSRDWIRPASGGRFVVAGGILRAALCVADRFARFESAKPILQKLSRETGLSCKMSIRQGDEQVTVLREESPKPMCVSGRVGARFPVIEGSVGAALLSGESEAFIRACAAACREMIPETETPELILNRVLEIRSKGYCLVDSRERWHVLAISAPIRDREGRVNAAVTLLGFPE